MECVVGLLDVVQMILLSKSISGGLYLYFRIFVQFHLFFFHTTTNSSILMVLIFLFYYFCFFLINSSGNLRSSNGFIGLPYHVSQSSSCQLRGQNCYVEVTLGCPKSASEKALHLNSNSIRNLPKHHVSESPAVGREKKGSPDRLSVHEKTFIYPTEAVLVPVLQTSFARSSLRR